MHTVRIVVVGAGLSGLYAAYLLERQGITDYVLLEGRDVLGGRIASIDATGQTVTHTAANTHAIDRFDLGPTWFWPGYQRELDRLVEALGLERFEQFEEGDMVVERSPEEPPVRMRGYVNSPASMRLVGGMGSLIEALRDTLAPANIITGHAVRRLRKHDHHIELESEDAAGHISAWHAEHVLLALPPRLVESTLVFEPALPASLAQQWRETATWMAPQAKYVAIYDTPFWQEKGLSGEGRSARGPLGEIHDASMPGGSAALFGFLGVPANVRSTVSDEVMRTHCRAQLVRMFGPLAATPKAEAISSFLGATAMNATYRAMQVTRPGVLELVERPTTAPGIGQVLIAVEACGICGADVGDIEGADPALQPPRVPGHEVVGRIAALGEHVPSLWKVGQRVGVGRLGGPCGECVQCRQGHFQLCQHQPFVGATCDGGYAEMMLARASGLVSIPDELLAEEAAPLLCAGIATFNALKKCGAQAGDTVAIFGIGGLGHMALQYARRMGFRVVAIGRGSDIAEDALNLGAHLYIDTHAEDAAATLKEMGGVQAIVSTISAPVAVSALLAGLAPQGRLVLLGAGKDPLPVSAGHLVVGERSLLGSITGSPYENEKTLDFSVLAGVRPRIEVMPFEQANEAYQRMKSGDVKFRMVLTLATASARPSTRDDDLERGTRYP